MTTYLHGLFSEGIQYAFFKEENTTAPKSRKEAVWKNMPFLEIVMEFSNKLTKPDKRAV